MTQGQRVIKERLRQLHEVLFCLNLAFAFAVVATSFLVREADVRYELAAHGGGTISLNFLLRILFSINRFLYHWPYLPMGPLTSDVVLTGLMIAFFALLLLLMRAVLRADSIGVTLNLVGGITALTAVPAAWLFLFHYYAPIWLLVLYFAVIGGALYLSRKNPNPIWFVVIAFHYIALGWLLHQAVWPQHGIQLLSECPILLSAVSPCASVVWALYRMRVLKYPTRRVWNLNGRAVHP